MPTCVPFFAIYLHTLQAVLRPSLLFFQLQFALIKCVRVNLAATNWTRVTVLSVLPAPALHSHPCSSRGKTKTGLAVVPNCGHRLLCIGCPMKGRLLLEIPCIGNPFHCYCSSKSSWNMFGIQRVAGTIIKFA